LATFFEFNLQRDSVNKHGRGGETISHVLALAKLTFFALGNPKLLEHVSKFLVFLVVFRSRTRFDGFTVSVVILRDERRVIASCSGCQCAKGLVDFVVRYLAAGEEAIT